MLLQLRPQILHTEGNNPFHRADVVVATYRDTERKETGSISAITRLLLQRLPHGESEMNGRRVHHQYSAVAAVTVTVVRQTALPDAPLNFRW